MSTPASSAPVTQIASANSIIVRMASRFGIDPSKMLSTLKATAFRQSGDAPEVSNEQMMALLVVAEQYGLNPWTRELYAFPDRKNGIVPVVGLDGWSRIVNEHPQFDGMDFTDGPAFDDGKHKGAPQWIECVMYRKDRAHPIRVRERMAECYRDTGPWNSHPARMLRTKSMIQCARVAFGFVGVFDDDEAQRIIEGNSMTVSDAPAAILAINKAIEHKPVEPLVPGVVGKAGEAVEAASETKAAADETKTSKRETKAAKGETAKATAPTWQDVVDRIEAAKTEDELLTAGDLIRSLEDVGQRESAQKLFDERVANFGEAK